MGSNLKIITVYITMYPEGDEGGGINTQRRSLAALAKERREMKDDAEA